MSIESIARQIASVDREINTIERNIQTIDGNISRKQKEAHNILSKISREKDLKRVITYQKDLNRKNDEIGKLETDVNTLQVMNATLHEIHWKKLSKLETENKALKETLRDIKSSGYTFLERNQVIDEALREKN